MYSMIELAKLVLAFYQIFTFYCMLKSDPGSKIKKDCKILNKLILFRNLQR